MASWLLPIVFFPIVIINAIVWKWTRFGGTIVCVMLIVANTTVALCHGVSIPPIALSGVLASATAYLLQNAVCTGTITTAQDGCVQYVTRPFLFFSLFMLLLLFYDMALFLPWGIK